MTVHDHELLDRFLGASDRHVIAALLGWRAQLRGEISPRLRERLERNVKILAAEVKRRGLKMPKSKALYPSAGSNTVIRIGANGDVSTETYGTPRPPRPQRKPRPDLKPAPADGGELLGLLEESLKQQLRK